MTLTGTLKSIIYFSLAIIPMLAWYVSEETFFPYITGKGFAFRFLIEVTFVSWIALAIYEPAFRPKSSLVFYSYALFLSIICAANIFGVNPYFSFFGNYERMEGWFTHLHLFLYFTVLYSVYKTSGDWLRMWGWFTVAAIAVNVQGLLQLFGQKDFFLVKAFGVRAEGFVTFLNTAYPTSMGNGLRLDSTLGNAAYYGIFTLFFVFISALLAYNMKKWSGTQSWLSFFAVVVSVGMILLERFMLIAANGLVSINQGLAQSLAIFGKFVWFAGIIGLVFFGLSFVKKVAAGQIGSWIFVLLAGINVILLAFTQTRGSYFGLIAGALISVICIILFGGKKYKKLVKGSVIAMGLFALLVVGLVAIKDTAFAQNSVVLKRISTIRIANIVLHPVQSYDMIANEKNDYPSLITYFGEQTIVSRFLNAKMAIDGINDTTKTTLLGYGQENYSTVFSEKYDPRMYAQEAWFDRAHNVFMDWLVAGGVLGLAAYLALYLTPIYMMWAGRGKENMSVVERAITTGMLVAYFVHNVFVFDSLSSYVIFIAILAYVSARTRVLDNVIKKETLEKHKNNKALEYALLTAGSAAGIALFIYTVSGPLSTNLSLISALRNVPNNYTTLAASSTANMKTYSSAINNNSFGQVEAREQLIQQAAKMVGIDTTKLQGGEKLSVDKAISDYKNYAESQFESMIAENETARNTSFYGSYLRQTGQYKKAEDYMALAHKLSPNKQLISFEYITALSANGKNKEALELAKNVYESETTFQTSKDIYYSIKQIISSSTVKVLKGGVK